MSMVEYRKDVIEFRLSKVSCSRYSFFVRKSL